MAGTVAHFEKQGLEPLETSVEIDGPGIYALYYEGELAEYQSIADAACPIYGGKAVPPEQGKVPGRLTLVRQHCGAGSGSTPNPLAQ